MSGYTVLTIPPNIQLPEIETALNGQLAFSAVNSSGALTYATGLQFAGVLDDLYYYPGRLGVVFHHDDQHGWHDWPDDDNCAIKLKVWAPTAQGVSLQLFNHESDTSPAAVIPMHNHNGVWVARGNPNWRDKYYLYSVKVWVPSDSAVDTNLTSDPYSIDIALNGTKSRITDLDSDETKPSGWDESFSPPLRSFSDMSVYELHVRDFSVNDPTVPAAHQGLYEAFSDQYSNGMKHLRSLAQSGLVAVHILPSFHFASVNEDKSTWIIPTGLSQYPPDGTQQQAAVTASQTSPAYNWGYDPVHYMTPEGSYAINPDNRVREYRIMVEGLHNAGLRVVQDVVFNHTNASGEGPNSNLDEVVPNYYHRLDANGNLEEGSCCPDTAAEHKMMEKLIIDSLVLNATQYKIDGFRFDIMSFMFTYNMTDIQKALRALTPEKDGVDGSKIYLYGEGFNFGDTENNQIGPNASQVNLYGFGIGTFNDRIRDGIRGGSPFTDERVQGFATGLFTDSSDYTNANPPTPSPQAQLGQYSDWILVGLTGNLRDYTFTDSHRRHRHRSRSQLQRPAHRIHQVPHRSHQLLLRPRQPGLLRRRAVEVLLQRLHRHPRPPPDHGHVPRHPRRRHSLLPGRRRPAPLQRHGPEQLRLRRLVQQDRLEREDRQLGHRPAHRQPEPGPVAHHDAAALELRLHTATRQHRLQRRSLPGAPADPLQLRPLPHADIH